MSVVMEAEARFRSLFSETYGTVERYARHRGVSGADLDDLVAATYEVAWRRFDRVPDGEQAVPWLLAVARNHLRNHRRRLVRDSGLLERLPAPAPTPGIGTDALIIREWREVRRALAALPAADREIVMLVAWDELTPAQAAVVLGITPGAARTRLHRARMRLAATLDEPPDTDRAAHAATSTVRSRTVRSTS
jgi:RNA polymerase sigma factor (sigma-70 family)